MKKIQARRGMNDLLPDKSAGWQYLEATISDLLDCYGYREIRFPIIESTDLFCRSIGEVTDIVEKEMYTFPDRNNESLTLRPEGTACCVRAAEQHGLLYNQIQRLWYRGPMFRYERPQKGRLRQFHQVGVETFGISSPDIDAELIAITARLWRTLGISEHLELQINSLGSIEARANYRTALVNYLDKYKSDLDEDSRRRLMTNPLRILDSKVASTQMLLNDAPDFMAYIDDESRVDYERLQVLLTACGIDFVHNPRLVRGLDYYNKTVFEWVTNTLGAQGTVCAGGRYDTLVEQLGGKATPAVGFAIGVERMVLMLEELNQFPEGIDQYLDVFVVCAEPDFSSAITVVEALREQLPHLRIQMNCGGGSFKNQMKKADKSTAVFALILGQEELAKNEVTVKFLRERKEQQTISGNKLMDFLISEL